MSETETGEVVEVAEAPEVPEVAIVEAAPAVADEVLLASAGLAQRALLEVTAPETVGSMTGYTVEGERVLSLHFAADLAGYPGWHWSVTIARVDDAEPTVLETELMPGEQALLAPEWVPWSERLAEYRATQAAAAAAHEDGAALEADAEGDFEHGDEDDLDDESDDVDFDVDADDADFGDGDFGDADEFDDDDDDVDIDALHALDEEE